MKALMSAIIPNVRLLPVVMLTALVLLGFKALSLAENAAVLLSASGDAVAMPIDGDNTASDGKKAPGGDANTGLVTNIDSLAAIAPSSGQETAGQEAAGQETAGQEASDQDNGPDESAGGTPGEGPEDTAQPAFMTRSEIDLLQDLAARRKQLDARSQQLDTRERLLMATEKRIDKKIDRLKGIEAEITDMIGLHDAEEEAQLKSLVKIYESMKPDDAARIMNDLDMDVLIKVIERMKERKIAPVLAEMSPDTAKAVTIEMATRKELPRLDEQS